MDPNQEPLLDVAVRISDGEPVDWVAVEPRLDNETARSLGRCLEVIENIGRIHAVAGLREDSAVGSRDVDGVAAVSTVASEPTVPQEEAMPTAWGSFRDLRLIGEGGFGQVFRAHDPSLDRDVALKLAHPKRGSPHGSIPGFIDEGRRMARVQHPNVVQVFGAEVHDGRPGLWMEYLEGMTFEKLLELQGPFSDQEAGHVAIQICRAIAAVHKVGIVHRDISDRNVIRAKGGRIVLMDFGAGSDFGADGRATLPELAGTPAYIAPEIFLGRPASTRSDLYSLGVLIFRLLSGRYPVVGKTVAEIARSHVEGRMHLLREFRPDLPSGILQVVDRALARDPEARFSSAASMEAALTAAIGRLQFDEASEERGRGKRWRQWKLVVPVVVAVLTLAMGQWVLRTQGEPDEVATAPATDTCRIRATMARNRHGITERMMEGARVQPGDRLSLEVETTDSLYLYVVSRDDRGATYLLFPHPEVTPSNPLAAGRYRLPGNMGEDPIDWQVSSAGGSENYYLLASRRRPLDLELELFALDPPEQMNLGGPLDETLASRQRATGQFVPRERSPMGPRLEELLDQATTLAGDFEGVLEIWSRRIRFENRDGTP